MAASNFYEVRCENCRTSFPPETKRCIHCGGPIGGRLRLGASAEDDEQSPVPSRARNLLWLVTAVLAVVMSVLRNCTPG
jgi:ribosomal protein L37E